MRARLFLLDTTLRDGELSTRFNPASSERLDIAQALGNQTCFK